MTLFYLISAAVFSGIVVADVTGVVGALGAIVVVEIMVVVLVLLESLVFCVLVLMWDVCLKECIH